MIRKANFLRIKVRPASKVLTVYFSTALEKHLKPKLSGYESFIIGGDFVPRVEPC